MSGPLITAEELDDMEEFAGKVSTGDRWLRLCQEVRRLRADPGVAERDRVLAYLRAESLRLNRVEGCLSAVRRIVRHLLGAIERGEHVK